MKQLLFEYLSHTLKGNISGILARTKLWELRNREQSNGIFSSINKDVSILLSSVHLAKDRVHSTSYKSKKRHPNSYPIPCGKFVLYKSTYKSDHVSMVDVV